MILVYLVYVIFYCALMGHKIMDWFREKCTGTPHSFEKNYGFL